MKADQTVADKIIEDYNMECVVHALNKDFEARDKVYRNRDCLIAYYEENNKLYKIINHMQCCENCNINPEQGRCDYYGTCVHGMQGKNKTNKLAKNHWEIQPL